MCFLLGPRTKSPQEIDDEADQQNGAKPSSADKRSSNVKAAAAKQNKKDKDK